jgi:osmoprotectant transport system substrate-binding protein
MSLVSRTVRRSLSVAAVAGLLGTAAACGGGGGGGGGGDGKASAGSLASSVDLKGTSIRVGSKEFTEQLVLGKLLALTLKAAGANVKETKLVGTPVVRKALTAGKIDVYDEYTGTGWINILGNTNPVKGAQAQFDAVKQADAKNNVVWLARAEANNTYAIAGNQQAVKTNGTKTISDYASLVKKNPSAAALCTASEFVTRDDGLPGLSRTYGFSLPRNQVKTLDFGLVFSSVGKGKTCKYAVVFATDGQILAQKLTVLKDDKGFFPTYNIATTIRKSTYDKNKAAYDKLFTGLNSKLTNDVMTKLNAAVDVEGKPVDRVAADFLKQNKII